MREIEFQNPKSIQIATTRPSHVQISTSHINARKSQFFLVIFNCRNHRSETVWLQNATLKSSFVDRIVKNKEMGS